MTTTIFVLSGFNNWAINKWYTINIEFKVRLNDISYHANLECIFALSANSSTNYQTKTKQTYNSKKINMYTIYIMGI